MRGYQYNVALFTALFDNVGRAREKSKVPHANVLVHISPTAQPLTAMGQRVFQEVFVNISYTNVSRDKNTPQPQPYIFSKCFLPKQHYNAST